MVIISFVHCKTMVNIEYELYDYLAAILYQSKNYSFEIKCVMENDSNILHIKRLDWAHILLMLILHIYLKS